MACIFPAIHSTDEVYSEGLREPCILLKVNWCLSNLAAVCPAHIMNSSNELALYRGAHYKL